MERLLIPEGARILAIDPDDLMLDNPAAQIVNRESYDSMRAHFSQVRFSTSPPPSC